MPELPGDLQTSGNVTRKIGRLTAAYRCWDIRQREIQIVRKLMPQPMGSDLELTLGDARAYSGPR